MAKQIMAATCDECGTVVAIPPHSTPAIRVAREIASRPLEVVMAAPFMDIVDLATYRIDPSASVILRKSLIAHFVHRSVNDDSLMERLRRNAEVHRSGKAGTIPRQNVSRICGASIDFKAVFQSYLTFLRTSLPSAETVRS